MRYRLKKGFTLIELMIVVAIIAIIAIVAIPRLRSSWNQAKETPVEDGSSRDGARGNAN